jgi:hypothetical protein
MSGLGAEHVWFRALTRDKAEMSVMFSYCFCNLVFRPDKSGWDLVAEEIELGWTCLAIVPGIQSETRICPVFLGTLVCG